MGSTYRARRGPVPDGSGPVGDERLDLAAGRGLRHHCDHDPGGDHPLRAGDGGADDHRWEARRPLGPAASVLDRPGDLRVRLGADRGLVERADAGPGLVGPRGDRRCDGAAGAGRSHRRHLHRQGAGDRLRRPRRRRRRRDRGRPDPRRLVHHQPLLAGRLRRRGRARDCDPAVRPAAPRARGRGAPRGTGLGRLGAHRVRAGADRVRRPAGVQLGLARAAQFAGRAIRLFPDPVHGRRRGGAAASPSAPGSVAASRAACPSSSTSDCSRSPPCAAGWRCSWPRT